MRFNNDKINYLNKYKNCLNQNINSEYYVHEIKGFVDYAISKKYEELQARHHRLLLMLDIKQKIENLGCETQKKVLINRYLRLMKWEDISEKMGYSLQHIHRLHNMALKEFEM